MNYETQKQLLALRFSCAFCGYGSKLDLKECPGCGRVKKKTNRKAREPENAPRLRSNDGVLESFANALPIAECRVYVCEHCRYQALRQLAECPECGRGKFAESDVPARRRDAADFRSRRAPSNRSEIGKFLLMLGASLFVGAFFTFLGFGPSEYRRPVKIVAGVGDNWQPALIFFLLGIACVVPGIILKSKD